MASGGELANWPFWPTRMRIHPLTRLTGDEITGQWMIEARIEFQDSQGATSKAVGQLTLEIIDGELPPAQAETIEFWNQDLRDPAINQRQYDVVFRTYLFRLQINSSTLPEQPELYAHFLSADGQTMEASMKIQKRSALSTQRSGLDAADR